ncbi:MAG: cupredoxin domain-containing protein [Chloroflexi bacterium]|nr:cupredoxin domain-containing protein [Chloroflexota bacterium]
MKKLILLLAVFTLVLTACGGKAVDAAAITVTMKEFAFDPNPIKVSAGTPVEITLMNEGSVEHDFVIEVISVTDLSTEGGMGEHEMSTEHEEFDLHTSVAAGGTGILRFTPTEPGTYQIFCSVPGHKEAGMIAELIVE